MRRASSTELGQTWLNIAFGYSREVLRFLTTKRRRGQEEPVGVIECPADVRRFLEEMTGLDRWDNLSPELQKTITTIAQRFADVVRLEDSPSKFDSPHFTWEGKRYEAPPSATEPNIAIRLPSDNEEDDDAGELVKVTDWQSVWVASAIEKVPADQVDNYQIVYACPVETLH